jgi:hypothetical protein
VAEELQRLLNEYVESRVREALASEHVQASLAERLKAGVVGFAVVGRARAAGAVSIIQGLGCCWFAGRGAALASEHGPPGRAFVGEVSLGFVGQPGGFPGVLQASPVGSLGFCRPPFVQVSLAERLKVISWGYAGRQGRAGLGQQASTTVSHSLDCAVVYTYRLSQQWLRTTQQALAATGFRV